jgi:hypothetical protein
MSRTTLLRGALTAAALVLAAGAPGRAGELTPLDFGARQLISAQLASGLFEFDMDFVAGKGAGAGATTPQAIMFIAREAGAIFALAKYYAHTRNDEARPVLEKALAALGEVSLPVGKPAPERWLERIGLLELPVLRVTLARTLNGTGLLYSTTGPGRVVGYRQDYAMVWGGTTALALVAELYYSATSGDERFKALREQWLEGLLTFYIPGRGFRGRIAGIDEDAYASGEAWLALALYSRMKRDAEMPLAAIDEHMTQHYAAAPNGGFFHWGMMAAAQRFAATADPRLAEFARAQARHFLEASRTEQSKDENTCSLVEGLAAALKLLRPEGQDGALVTAIRARIAAELTKSLALQIQPGQEEIALDGGAVLRSPAIARFAGAFLAGRLGPSVRVDFTQHCLSALVEAAGLPAPG